MASAVAPPSGTAASASSIADAAKKLSLNDASGLEPNKKLWLEAWHDPVAGVKAFSPCVTTADLFGDGDWRLVIACMDMTLKVWKGTEKKAEQTMLQIPVAITSFNSQVTGNSKDSELPALAVASGSSVFIYRNLRPYYKFALPSDPINPEEENIWRSLDASEDHEQAQAALAGLRDQGVKLTQQSADYLCQPDHHTRAAFAYTCKGQQLTSPTCVTCLSTVYKGHEEEGSTACLMVGTESGNLLVLNTMGTAVDKTIDLKSVPTHVVNIGVLDIEWRTVVACRDGKVMQIKNGEVQNNSTIELEAPCVALLRNQKSFIIGCMNQTIHQYQMKGKKTYSIYLPAPILAMEAMKANKKMQTVYAVAIKTGEVRVYNEKNVMAVHKLDSPVSALHFGRYGREDNTLVTVMKSGAIDIRILPRQANLDVAGSGSGPPPEQDVPLDVPKKTKQYVEQTQRERDQAVDMHRTFQRDLCKLRLASARAYVKVLTDGQGQMSYTTGASLRLKADVSGLGPAFRLKMRIQNTGAKPVMNMPIMLIYNEKLYSAVQNQIIVPLLVPHVEYSTEVSLHCLDPGAQYSDDLRIVMINGESCVPILSALIRIPLSDILDD